MKFYLLTALFLLSVLFSFAQKQAYIWYFGDQAGLDFNSGTPAPLSNGQMNTLEGCASIADKSTGQLLFYTDGTSVWDRNQIMMPNGEFDLLGNFSSTQSAVVIPMPGSTTQYYIFTVDAQAGSFDASTSGFGGLAYSIVNMSLNGGNGDISTLNVELIAPTCEKLTAVRNCNGKDIWVIVHQWDTNAFYAYLVTSAGVQPPVISNAGEVQYDSAGTGANWEAIGYMKCSPDGKKLAMATSYYLNAVQIFDFDNSTGVISNPLIDRSIPVTYEFDENTFEEEPVNGPYGVTFSPDNSKLYIVSSGDPYYSVPSIVYQYNMLASNILTSRTQINSNSSYNVAACQIGPDGKIYVTKASEYSGSSYLDVITNPNGLGTACNYVANQLYLGSVGTALLGLPDMVESFTAVPYTASLNYSTCAGNDTLTFQDTILNGTINVLWNFGDPASGTSDTSTLQSPSHTFSSSGSHTISFYVSNACATDSFTQTIVVGSGNITATATPADTSVCAGDMIQLQASTGGTSYRWSPSSWMSDSTVANPLVFPLSTVTYSVTVTSGGCNATATVSINVNPDPAVPTIRESHDTLYCTVDTSYTSYQWYFNDTLIQGATSYYIIFTKSGNYNIAVTNRYSCPISAGINIIIVPNGIEEISSHNEINLFPNPVQNELTISGSLPAGKITLSIYDVLGRIIYSSEETTSSSFKKIIDVSSYSKGVYFIQMQQAESKLVRKFVKE